MNKSAIKLGWLVMVLLVTVTHGAPVFPLPPFTVYGKVRDWNGRALVTADEAVVIARTIACREFCKRKGHGKSLGA